MLAKAEEKIISGLGFTPGACACVRIECGRCRQTGRQVHGAGGGPRQAQVFTAGRRMADPVPARNFFAFLSTPCGRCCACRGALSAP